MGNLSLKKTNDGFVFLTGLQQSELSSLIYMIDPKDTGMSFIDVITYKNLNITSIAGNTRMAFLEHICRTMRALIFVVDSTNRESLIKSDEIYWGAREYLHYILSYPLPELEDLIVLILATKQDLSNALSIEEIRSLLHMEKITTISAEYLMKIRLETLLNLLPHYLISLIAEYTAEIITAPNIMLNIEPQHLTNIMNNDSRSEMLADTQWKNVDLKMRFLHMICEYLSPVFILGRQKRCNILPCDSSGKGLFEALDWLVLEMSKRRQDSQKDCILQ